MLKTRIGLILLVVCLVPGRGAQSQAVHLVVGEKIVSSVGFYTPDGERVAGVAVGKHPHELALSPDGRDLYVSDNGILWMSEPGEGGNTISIINVGGREKVGVIDLGPYRRPHGMAVGPRSGRLVATIENPDGLLLIDPRQRKVIRKYETKGRSPHMVTLGPKGEWAYVSNAASGTVAAVHLETGEVKLIPTDGRPQGGVVSHDGKVLYITNSDGNSISIIDTAKKERVGTIATGKGPGRIVLTPDGNQLLYNLQAGNAVGFADVKSRKQTTVIPLEGPVSELVSRREGSLHRRPVARQGLCHLH